MSAFFTGLAGVLSGFISTLIGRIALFLGLGAISFTGMNSLLDSIKAGLIAGFGGLPADAVSLLEIAGFFVGVNVIFQSVLIKVVLKGFSSEGILKVLGSFGGKS
jgi:hypothetical protein